MSAHFRVLALTTRRNVTVEWLDEMRTRMDLGDALCLELLTVWPTRTDLPAARLDAVDLSRVPWRPVVPVAGDGTVGWGGARKTAVRGLRASRKAIARLRGRPSSVDPARALEIACQTSPQLGSRAREVDVVLALDGQAARSVAALGRRAPEVKLVFGPRNVRAALEAAGHEVPPGAEGDASADQDSTVMTRLPAVADENARVLIAPANYAGQAHAWAEAIRRHVDGAVAINLQAGAHPHFPFLTDIEVDRHTFAASLEWRMQLRRWVFESFSHVVVEANRPLLGHATDSRSHVLELRRAGKQVALLSHGSDARIPSVHAAAEPWHSYGAAPADTLRRLERAASANCAYYNTFDGTVFVSTPGLRAFIPKALWLPLVVDTDLWKSDEVPLARERPIVAHIPSSWQKGSHIIDPILESMRDRGLIEYRRVENVARADMPKAYGTADIVVEQFGIADYSTAAVEAMAGGRVVVSRVADPVRKHVAEQTGLELPIIEANPETLESVILRVIEDREGSRDVARRGVEFAKAVHDGRRSAAILEAWIRGL